MEIWGFENLKIWGFVITTLADKMVYSKSTVPQVWINIHKQFGNCHEKYKSVNR